MLRFRRRCHRLFNNPTGAGTMTSGGTESIIMAMKAHRDWARATKGITEPEMSVCDFGRAIVFSQLLQDHSRIRRRRV